MADTPAIGPAVVTFRFDVLLNEADRTYPVSVTEDGLLLVAGRSKWRPERFSPDMRGIVCRQVDPPTEA